MQSLYRNLPDYIMFGSIYFKTIFCQEELKKEKRPQRKKKVQCLLLSIFWSMKE